ALAHVVAVGGAAGFQDGGIWTVARLAVVPVVVADVAAHHPAVREPLVEGQRGALEGGLVVTVVQEETLAGGDAGTELVIGHRDHLAVRQDDGGQVAAAGEVDLVVGAYRHPGG